MFNLPVSIYRLFFFIGHGVDFGGGLTLADFHVVEGVGLDVETAVFELEAIGCPRPEQIFDTKWFTTRNFHGMWYLDGDVLENYLHFRANVPVKEYFAQMSRSASLPAAIKFDRITKVAKLLPHIVKLVMRSMANKPVHGTQTWIKERNAQRIAAYYGSLEKYNAIPDWKHTDLSHNADKAVWLDHGYDEQKPMTDFTIDDMRRAAEFRGGKCLSQTMATGDWDTQLEWQCAEGHTFMYSYEHPYSMFSLKATAVHSCPVK